MTAPPVIITPPMRTPIGEYDKLRVVQVVCAALCLAFVALVVVANMGCAPSYFQRGDVAAMLLVALVLAATLLWATSADSDLRRSTGSAACGAMTGLFLGTVSIPVIAVPLSILGCFRLPRSGRARAGLAVLVLAAAVAGLALPYVTRDLMGVTQFTC